MNTAGGENLYIKVSSYKHESGLYGFHISVRLLQDVYLVRDPSTIVYNASTWNMGYIGTTGASNVNVLRDYVKNLVDMFLNDYLSVNPKD